MLLGMYGSYHVHLTLCSCKYPLCDSWFAWLRGRISFRISLSCSPPKCVSLLNSSLLFRGAFKSRARRLNVFQDASLDSVMVVCKCVISPPCCSTNALSMRLAKPCPRATLSTATCQTNKVLGV